MHLRVEQSAWNFWPYFFGVVAIGVILTGMFNTAGGSLLIAFLFHAQMNGPGWPDAQPWDMVCFVLVAIGVVWVHQHTMLRRDTGCTGALLGDDPAVTETATSFEQRSSGQRLDPTATTPRPPRGGEPR